jgi:AraC-like DNA-binding protein
MRGERGSRPTILRCRLSLTRRSGTLSWSDRALVRQGAWDLEPVVSLLTDEAVGEQPQHEARLRSLAVLLLTGMARGDAASSGLDARQRGALAELVDRHRAHGLEPRDLAAHLGLTLDYFTRRFRLVYGMPPRRWLVRERVRAACVLLAEGRSELETVAQALGYADIKLFGRQFTQVMGVPPGRWRQQRASSGG